MCLLALVFFNRYTYFCVFFIIIIIDRIVYFPVKTVFNKLLLFIKILLPHYLNGILKEDRKDKIKTTYECHYLLVYVDNLLKHYTIKFKYVI